MISALGRARAERRSNRDWADCLDLVDSPETFVATIKRRLVEGVPESQRVARSRLEQEGWDEKAREFERLIENEE
jgi:hypothetical protein